MTSHACDDPGNISTRSQQSLAYCACCGSAKVTNAHWRPGSQPVFRKQSTMWPYFENSARIEASVMLSGKDPTKIFLGPSTATGCSCGWYDATAVAYCGACAAAVLSCPNMPWFRAKVTSHARCAPANIRTRSVLCFAYWACSGEAKVMKAHWRPGSHPVLTKTSRISPYFENSARRLVSSMSSGKDPTKIFFGTGATGAATTAG
mmetsp:Transcript_47877/g.145598  ORF Transcript_47877/g.145598 Transcript_47877/m.145598 type:complete len:205 (-) Transcript_47877:710-1324(-)